MRRKNHATGVPGPVHCVERCIVFGQIRIAAISKDAFHEIEIADQAPGREKTNLHRFPGIGSSGGADDRPQQQRNKKTSRRILIRGERQRENLWRRPQCGGEQRSECLLGNGYFVSWNRKTAFDNMKNSLRGPAIGFWIMEDSLRQAIRLQIWRRESIRAGRQR